MPLTFLIWGGVFDRHPGLRVAITEGSCIWVPEYLALLGHRYHDHHTSAKVGDFSSHLSMSPSDYFRRNVADGASVLARREVDERAAILGLNAARFYEEGLGLAVHSRTDVNETCKEAIMHCPAEDPWLQLAHHLDREGPIDHGNAFWKLSVNTDDCKALFSKAVAAGAKPTMDPTPLDKWPVTIALLRDLGGANS